MSKFEVLCVTMHQKDFSKIEAMNIHSDVVFANQADTTSYEELEFDGHRAKMITTATRGVGINRNCALTYASAQIVLFADDDVRYNDDYVQRVLAAFDELPKADIIAFGIDTLKDGELIRGKRNSTKRRHLWNCMRYGACVLAVRRASLLKANLCFTQLFGGGAIYCSGEDSLFLRQCVGKGLKIYSYDYCLGTTCKDTSSWFSGFDEKFFYDRGAWISEAFRFGRPLLMRLLFRSHLKWTELPRKTALRLMKQGIRGYRTLTPFSKYME